MSAETLLVILFVGLVAGWLAGQIVRGTGFGLVADIAIGIVGALIGSWLLPHLGIHLGSGIIPWVRWCFCLSSDSLTGAAGGGRGLSPSRAGRRLQPGAHSVLKLEPQAEGPVAWPFRS